MESGLGGERAFYASYRRSLTDPFYPDGEEEELESEAGIRVDNLPVYDDYMPCVLKGRTASISWPATIRASIRRSA